MVMSIQDVFGMIWDGALYLPEGTCMMNVKKLNDSKYDTEEDKKMKKIITFLVTVVMCMNLIACGGVDTQPAIDSYNQLADNYNEFVDIVNENIDEVSDEDIELFNEVTAAMDEYAEMLSGDTEFTQEEVDEMVKTFDDFNAVIVEALESME